MTFNRGAVYIHDGVGTPLGKGLGTVNELWKTFNIHHKVAAEVARLELWVQLVFEDRTITPGKGTLSFDAMLDIV